jgi:hypothetical protein
MFADGDFTEAERACTKLSMPVSTRLHARSISLTHPLTDSSTHSLPLSLSLSLLLTHAHTLFHCRWVIPCKSSCFLNSDTEGHAVSCGEAAGNFTF